MSAPTDDELLAAARENGIEGPFATLRRVVEAPTCDAALRALGFPPEPSVIREKCRALRSRFPQPITDAVLRACGLKPSEPGSKRWQDDKIEAWPNRDDSRLWCVQAIDEDGWFGARTADRFAAVCDHLRGLYGEEDSE